MDFPTGLSGRDGWDPVSAAAPCLCAVGAVCPCVQCAQHHLTSPLRAGTFGNGDALNCLSSLGGCFFPVLPLELLQVCQYVWWEMGGRATVYGLSWTEFHCKVVCYGEGLDLDYRGPFQVSGRMCLLWCLCCFSVISIQATIQASILFFFFPGGSRERRGLFRLV